MQHRILLWPLILLLPLAGVRMICVERPAPAAANISAAGAKCDRFCPAPGGPERTTPAGQDAAQDETGCVLFADGSLHILVGGVAILPTPPSVKPSFAPLPATPDVPDAYLAPLLPRLTPPPRV